MLDYIYNKSFDWDQMFLPGRLTAFDGRKAGIAAVDIISSISVGTNEKFTER